MATKTTSPRYDCFHDPVYFPHEYGAGEKLGYCDFRVYHDDGEFRYRMFSKHYDSSFKPFHFSVMAAHPDINMDEISCWRRRHHSYNTYPATGNPVLGFGIPDPGGQPQPVAHWPEPLTELGRKYVKELKKRKREEEMAGTAVPPPQIDHH
jgi:hypothetical protein